MLKCKSGKKSNKNVLNLNKIVVNKTVPTVAKKTNRRKYV